MVSIEFEYSQGITFIQAKETDMFKEVIETYYRKTMIPKDTVYFFVNGTITDPKRPVSSYMNNNSVALKILVNQIYIETKTKVQESKDVIS